ncbi:MAG: shikimate dehydrogenase [Bacteroidia bacterium]|jgi:shikimate 5-dehydrogenase
MYIEAQKRTMYFIGVTTSKSSIMKVFSEWAKYLQLGDVEIKGIDFKMHDEPAKYREAVDFIKNDKNSLGALVTTHKIDLLAACRDQFEQLDEYAGLMHEISSISKVDGKLVGHAKDPITSGLALQAFLPENYWEKTGAEVLILGAGGSGLALSWHLSKKEFGLNRPSKIIVVNRSSGRIDEMKEIHEKIGLDIPVEYHVVGSSTSKSDAILRCLKPGSLVVNATGLGKDTQGSPFTDDCEYPENCIVWDFNYRGELVFLDQARNQQKAKKLQIEDGWIYFLHGWTRVIAEVFHIEIPTQGAFFNELSNIASGTRQKNS